MGTIVVHMPAVGESQDKWTNMLVVAYGLFSFL